MKRIETIVLVLMASLCMVSSCKKDDDNNTGINTQNLLGTWKKPYQSYTVGVSFKNDGHFSFGVYSGSVYAETITGDYSTNGAGVITFSNQSGSMEACPATTCTYDFTAGATSLVMVVKNDPCTGRSDKIGGAWSK